MICPPITLVSCTEWSICHRISLETFWLIVWPWARTHCGWYQSHQRTWLCLAFFYLCDSGGFHWLLWYLVSKLDSKIRLITRDDSIKQVWFSLKILDDVLTHLHAAPLLINQLSWHLFFSTCPNLWWQSSKYCNFLCPANLLLFELTITIQLALTDQCWPQSYLLKASNSWSHLSPLHNPLWTSCTIQKQVYMIWCYLHTLAEAFKVFVTVFPCWIKNFRFIHCSMSILQLNALKERWCSWFACFLCYHYALCCDVRLCIVTFSRRISQCSSPGCGSVTRAKKNKWQRKIWKTGFAYEVVGVTFYELSLALLWPLTFSGMQHQF